MLGKLKIKRIAHFIKISIGFLLFCFCLLSIVQIKIETKLSLSPVQLHAYRRFVCDLFPNLVNIGLLNCAEMLVP
jgi:hypothetical protein